MDFLSTNSIIDFENGFVSNRRELIPGAINLTKDDFLRSLRVFFWYDSVHGFEDIRDVCHKVMQSMKEDPLKLGLLHLLYSYVNKGVLDVTKLTGGISNNIPQTIRALSNTYIFLLKDSVPEMDLSIFTELEVKFKNLENARSHVLDYIGEKGYLYLNELMVIAHFHPSDVEEILYQLVVLNEERTKSEKNEIRNLIEHINQINNLDLSIDPNWMTEAILDFIDDVETAND